MVKSSWLRRRRLRSSSRSQSAGAVGRDVSNTRPAWATRSLRLEQLEPRRVLATDLAAIAGTVFDDVDGDGILDPGESGISGVTVSLTGTQLVGGSVNLTTSTLVDGSYRFDDLLAGSYVVTQVPPPPAGFLPNPGGSPASVTISANDAMGTINTLIDGFGGEPQLVTASLPGTGVGASSVPDLLALGNTRDVVATLTSNPGQTVMSSNVVTNPGVLASTSANNSTATYTATWDGDTDPGSIDYQGLDVDLTDGGASVGLQLMIGVDQPNQMLTVRLYSSSTDWSSATVPLTETGGLPDAEVIIPFANLVDDPGGAGVDLQDVGAIELQYVATDLGADFAVDVFGSIGPTVSVQNFANLSATPVIQIEKATNGLDADTATGPQLLVGSTASFTYEVSNAGNIALDSIVVSDDNGTPGNPGDNFNPAPVLSGIFNLGDTNTNGELDTNEVWQYTAQRTVTAGQYTNTALARGEDPADTQVTNTDPSNHFGLDLGIDIQKATNGQDADTPTGPQVAVGSTVTFAYEISNTGNSGLSSIVVTDDNGTAGVPGDDFNPSPILTGSFNTGDLNQNNVLDTTEVWQYTATRTATTGQHTNVGRASGLGPTGPEVTDQDTSNHFGVQVDVAIEKTTNGQDADTAPGPLVEVGSQVTFNYAVSNPGNTGLTNVVVEDDNGTPGNSADDFQPAPVLAGSFNIGDTNQDNTLDTTETWQFAANRTATAGQYTNSGTVTATSPLGPQVTGSDVSNHFGVDGRIALQKATNAIDADTPETAPEVYAGTTVVFTYAVSNVGNVPLSDVVVSDDAGTAIDDTDDFFATYTGGDTNRDDLLDLAEIWTYTASRTATEGVYRNIGTAAAIAPTDEPQGLNPVALRPLAVAVSASDPSGYFGLPAPPIVSKRRFLASS